MDKTTMEFKWVYLKDWYGVTGQYKILDLIKRDNEMYSCTFINSNGDMEKVAVREQDLF